VLSIILRPISRYLNIITTGRSLPEGLEEKAGRRRRLTHEEGLFPFSFPRADWSTWAAPFVFRFHAGFSF
jgi:hypothetical protein